MPAPTKSQTNKAGRILRKWWAGPHVNMTREVEEAVGVLWDWRAAHQYPLAKATMGLRSVVATERCRVEVTQRLKQAYTIIQKLGRQPSMGLATMQDIGGCRAVLGVHLRAPKGRKASSEEPAASCGERLHHDASLLRLQRGPLDRVLRRPGHRSATAYPSDARVGDRGGAPVRQDWDGSQERHRTPTCPRLARGHLGSDGA